MAIQTSPSFPGIQALIIDDMSVQQSTLKGHLGMLGIGKVDLASTAEEATKLIKQRRYNLILCDYNLNQKTDGQQLFEYLRDNSLLAADCLFFMITAESNYASVAAATEHSPDAYLLKPATAADIGDRLKTQLEKRAALLPISQKQLKDDLPGVLGECDNLMAQQNRWFMQALQIKGQTLLKLGKNDEAKGTYRAALEKRPELVWAQLGLARAHKAAGQFDEAKHLAQQIIQSREGEKNVAAYDVVAEALEAQGDPQAAMWVLRDAATVVPSARRQRIAGESAYRNGDLDTAKEFLHKATKATKGSVIAQAQDTLLLAQTLVDLGESADAVKLLKEAGPAYQTSPTFGNVALAIQAQAECKAGKPEEAQKLLAKARATMRKGRADFASVALAKAELMSGNVEVGLKLLSSTISADHENPRIKQMVSNTLRETGHEDKVHDIVDAGAVELENRVKDARKLFRDSKIDEAVRAIEGAVHDYPENTGVLLQAAQLNCMALRLKKVHNYDMIDRVQLYLTRLEKLMPTSDRVVMMRRYFRETMLELEKQPAQA
ncbi:MAG: tetratricopeptide repeat protein [Aquabacterium sp.]|uniref:tetratricopeptide repeat protein n=1 Tax=Aquabacterium sp. TaxID=1872578 RepID=UPI0025BEA95E|nr:tetratricopeptide repeat protein [Aquabacterium sp.]MBI5925544.1 tetratricopeptide repeat protein [Aquabacterium sp.]